MTKRLRSDFDPYSGYEEPYIYAATTPSLAANRQPPSFFIGSSRGGENHQSLRPSNIARRHLKDSASAPVQKRMRMDHESNAEQENISNEGKGGLEVVEFIKLAQDLGQCVVKHQDIDQALGILRGLRRVLSEEKDRASKIQSGDSLESPNNLSENIDLHWVNNFLFLQIGYLSSFKQNPRVPLQNVGANARNDVASRSKTSRGPWSDFASRLMDDTVRTLVVLHEYNFIRRCLANKLPTLHRLPTRGKFKPLQLSIQLSESESRECGNILCKFIRRTLDKMAFAWSRGNEKNNTKYISSLQDGVNVLDLLQKSMFTTGSIFRNDERTLETLVRVIADVSFNATPTSSTRSILNQSTSLLRTLSSRTNFDTDLPLSEYASICSDIIIACSLHFSVAVSHTWHSLNHNCDNNHRFFFSFLEKLRVALYERDDPCIQQKWQMLIRTMEIMLRTANSGERVVRTILTVINYISMSPQIVRILADDESLLVAISSVATKQNASYKKKSSHDQVDVRTAAMQCITSLATKLVKFCHDQHSGCLNIVTTLLNMARVDQVLLHGRGDVVKGLRLFVGRNVNELNEGARRLPESERKEVLQLLVTIAISKQHSRSMREAAVILVVELYFHQPGLEDSSYTQFKDSVRRLFESDDLWGEGFIIQTLVGKIDFRENMMRLLDTASLLTSMISIASNERHTSHVRGETMRLIKELSPSPAIGKKLVAMKDFVECILDILSVDVVGENCVLYKHYGLETIIIVGRNHSAELADRQLIKALLSFTRKVPSDYDSFIAKKQNEHTTPESTKHTQSMKSQLQKLVEGLVSSM